RRTPFSKRTDNQGWPVHSICHSLPRYGSARRQSSRFRRSTQQVGSASKSPPSHRARPPPNTGVASGPVRDSAPPMLDDRREDPPPRLRTGRLGVRQPPRRDVPGARPQRRQPRDATVRQALTPVPLPLGRLLVGRPRRQRTFAGGKAV